MNQSVVNRPQHNISCEFVSKRADYQTVMSPIIALRLLSQLIVLLILRCVHCSLRTEDSDGSVFGLTIDANESLSNRLAVSIVSRYVCGSKIFCANNGETVTTGLCSYECSRCKCDDVCHFYGDCCPRKLFEYSSENPSKKEDFITCSGESSRLWGNESHIFMVSKCPNNTFSDKSVVDRCETPDITVFAEATPVSDMSTQITYANEFCARCHGIKHFQMWSQNVSCRIEADLGMARTREELWRLVMTDNTCAAKLQSLPPVGLELRTCYPSTIDKCNVTGKWVKNINPMAELLCGLYQHTVHYFGASTMYVSYRNVFCAICNGAWLEQIPCQRQKGTIPPPASVLLMFNPPQPTPEPDRSEKCQLNQIYDPLSVSTVTFQRFSKCFIYPLTMSLVTEATCPCHIRERYTFYSSSIDFMMNKATMSSGVGYTCTAHMFR